MHFIYSIYICVYVCMYYISFIYYIFVYIYIYYIYTLIYVYMYCKHIVNTKCYIYHVIHYISSIKNLILYILYIYVCVCACACFKIIYHQRYWKTVTTKLRASTGQCQRCSWLLWSICAPLLRRDRSIPKGKRLQSNAPEPEKLTDQSEQEVLARECRLEFGKRPLSSCFCIWNPDTAPHPWARSCHDTMIAGSNPRQTFRPIIPEANSTMKLATKMKQPHACKCCLCAAAWMSAWATTLGGKCCVGQWMNERMDGWIDRHMTASNFIPVMLFCSEIHPATLHDDVQRASSHCFREAIGCHLFSAYPVEPRGRVHWKPIRNQRIARLFPAASSIFCWRMPVKSMANSLSLTECKLLWLTYSSRDLQSV